MKTRWFLSDFKRSNRITMWRDGPRKTKAASVSWATSVNTLTSCRLWMHTIRSKQPPRCQATLKVTQTSSSKRTEQPTLISHSTRSEATRPALVTVSSQARAGPASQWPKSLRKKLCIWASTTWVTVPTQSRSSRQLKSKPVQESSFSLTVLCGSDLVISAQRMQGPESFIIEIDASKVDTLL